MEYVIVRATRPSWFTMQLPTEVAELIQFAPPSADPSTGGRSISFLARGPGVARVVATYPAREALAVETVRNRLIAVARPTDRLLLTLPSKVIEHLGLRSSPRGPRLRGTDDPLIWFVPAAEYAEFRGAEEKERPWKGPTGSPFAHVYLARSIIPLPFRPGELFEQERQIEEEEWKPGVAVLQRVGRPRKP